MYILLMPSLCKGDDGETLALQLHHNGMWFWRLKDPIGFLRQVRARWVKQCSSKSTRGLNDYMTKHMERLVLNVCAWILLGDDWETMWEIKAVLTDEVSIHLHRGLSNLMREALKLVLRHISYFIALDHFVIPLRRMIAQCLAS